MPSGFHTWSQTSGTNAAADASVNWAEGQSPSSVNDSARAMMAVQAKWRDDNNGFLTTGGTSTAFTLTTNTGFTTLALMDKQSIAFTMSATSGAAPTLNVDSLGAKPIRNSTGVTLPTGALVSGSVYRATYFNTAGEFLLENQPGAQPANSVNTQAIADANVTLAKIVNTSASRLLGNPTGSAAAPSEISLDATLAFSGTSLKVSPSTGLTAALAVDYATKVEQQAGTSGVKTVNPARQQDHPSAAKAWVCFGGGAGGAIQSSYNVASISRSSAGTYLVTFTVPFANASYSVFVTSEGSAGAGIIGHVQNGGRAVGSVAVECLNTTPVGADATTIHVVCYGAQ